MTVRPATIVAWLSIAAAVAGFSILGSTVWLDAAHSQLRAESLIPADQAGQVIFCQYDHPVSVEFLSLAASPEAEHPSPILADISIVGSPTSTIALAPVERDPETGRLNVPLRGVQAQSGESLLIVLHDTSNSAWLSGTEHDSYAGGHLVVRGVGLPGDLRFSVRYQRPLLSVLADGASAGLGSWNLLLMIVVVIGSAGLLASGVIRSSAELDITSLVAFSAPGGLLLITLPSYAIAVVHARYSASLVLVIALLMSALGAFLWSRRVTLPRTPTLCRTALAAFMISILLLRLAFAGDLVLPMYSDSVEHVLLIRDLLRPDMPYRAWHSVSTLLTNYYHIGSHAVSAWMLSATGAPSPANVLTIGQFMQAVTIGGLYFPVYAATKRSEPACCATLLGGVGWMMPGYASNWGKYPAMFGVAALPGVLGLIILAGSSGDVKRRPLRVLACLSIASAAVLHTRIVVVVGAFVLALIAGKALDRSLARRGTWDRSAVVCATAGAMGAAWASLQPHFTLDALGDLLTWCSKPPGLTSSLIALALLPFALRSYRRQTLVGMCFLLFLVLARSVPPYQDLHLPLLDGPIADMVVWLPLAAIGGLGVSGISESLRANWRHQLLGAIARVLPGVFFTAYCAWALTVQQDNPSECCITARGPDVEALNWARGHLPVNARVLIASEVRSASYSAAVDGGAWLEAVAERETIMESGSSSLTSPVVLSRLCDAGVTHVYFGGSNGSFNRLEVDLAPDLYSRSFATQGAAIYSINGCSDA